MMNYSSDDQKLEEEKLSKSGFYRLFKSIKERVDVNISQLLMENGDNFLYSTPGKIELHFESEVSWNLVSRTLKIISEIDNNAEHELKVETEYDEIERYEREGYVLVSYGKIEGDVYRVIFEIPFSRNSALRKFALSIYNSDAETKKNVLWDGGDKRISILYDKLSKHGWELNGIELVGEKDVRINFADNPSLDEVKKKIFEKLSKN